MKETFGEYIRILRKSSGLTLTQLAARLDLDSANLSKIENGKRTFDEKRLSKLANTFSLNLEKLETEFICDQLAKQIYECNCSKDMLIVAEEKAAYRRLANNKSNK